MSDSTQLLAAVEQHPLASEQLLSAELCQFAAQRVAHEKPGAPLRAAALVHDVYVRLVAPHPQRCWNSRGQFCAAEMMRRTDRESPAKKAARRARPLPAERDGRRQSPEEDLAAFSDSLGSWPIVRAVRDRALVCRRPRRPTGGMVAEGDRHDPIPINVATVISSTHSRRFSWQLLPREADNPFYGTSPESEQHVAVRSF